MKKKILFVAACITGSALFAQDSTKTLDPVIITANKIAQKQSNTGKVITVITKELIEKSSGRTVAQLLNEQAGLTINGALNNVYHSGSAHFAVSKTQCDIEYDIAVEAVNSCGTSLQSHANAYVPCNNYFMIAPNPATNNVSIAVDETKSAKGTDATFEEVTIYDLQGNLKKNQKYNKTKTASIDVSDLINGNYFIEIKSGAIRERKSLLIRK